ncbi:MAG: SEL1-like repeat protein [Rhizobiales bacterium]|nr:peptidoglycan-binding protein [Hyphomicrobiales bacterium]NRB14410.1 SEL1-like repeat protein [Hyphomicrobiales bacterium]
MTSSTPWSIKGIDSETRKIVKQHARKANQTMGEWLSNAVNTASHDGSQNRLDGLDSPIFSNLKKEFIADDTDNFNASGNAENMRNLRHDARLNRTNSRRNSLLGRPDAEDSHYIANDFSVIEDALTDIVDHIELADQNNSTALRNMQTQIARLHNSGHADENSSLQMLRQDFGDIETRLSTLADRMEDLNNSNSRIVQSVQGQHNILGEQTRRDQFDQANMVTRFDELFIKLDELNTHQADNSQNSKHAEYEMQNQLHDISDRMAEQSDTRDERHGNDLYSIEQRLQQLSDRLDEGLDAAPRIDPHISELEGQIDKLSFQLSGVLENQQAGYERGQDVYAAEEEVATADILELRDSIAIINERLQKTEERLGGIDRLEDNMVKLISSVTDIKANSYEIAKEAASHAVSEFADKNGHSEKTHLDGFKTVQHSLEKIMNRLSKVESGQPVREGRTHPPEYDGAGARADRDFTQPGAERKAAQPQDLNIPHSNNIQNAAPVSAVAAMPITAAPAVSSAPITNAQPNPITASYTPQKPEPQVTTPADMTEQANNLAEMSQTATNLNATNQPDMSLPVTSQTTTNPAMVNPTMANPTMANATMANPMSTNSMVTSPSAVSQADMRLALQNQATLTPEPTQASFTPPARQLDVQKSGSETAAPTDPNGSTPDNNRPEIRTSNSNDFIAAARRAAQQTYELEKTADPETGLNKSLFSKIKNAARRDKSQLDSQSILDQLEPLPAQMRGINVDALHKTSNQKTKSSWFKRGKNKKPKTAPTAVAAPQQLADPIAKHVNEDDFFSNLQSSDPATLMGQIGNELSANSRDEKTKKPTGLRPIVGAAVFVTVALAGASWYSLQGNVPKIPLENITASAGGKMVSSQSDAARDILDGAKIGIPTSNGSAKSSNNFTPSEFQQLPNIPNQTRQPTNEQLEAMQNKDSLVTNSIAKPASKPYTTSLLGNGQTTDGNLGSANLDAAKMGSSTLSKSKSNIQLASLAPKTTTAASELPQVTSHKPPKVVVLPQIVELPTEIGPKLLRENAVAGQAAEQFEVANRYALGYNVEVDLAKSYYWFSKAAGNKLAVAQFSVGMMLENGKGTDRDLAKAKISYEASANQGNLMAIYRLAMMNAAPQDPTTRPDFKQAIKWFNLAANAGLVDAQYNLAVLYQKGHGTEIDLVETFKWYSIAANKGDKQAEAKAGAVKLELSAAQILTAKQKIKTWQVTMLPETANTAPNLSYLKTELETNEAANEARASQTLHVKQGTLATNLNADEKSIKDTQKMLEFLGWNVGPIDGLMGKKTRKAISEFQMRHNLTITGEVNDELLANLEAATL